jgi:hypothetical protein
VGVTGGDRLIGFGSELMGERCLVGVEGEEDMLRETLRPSAESGIRTKTSIPSSHRTWVDCVAGGVGGGVEAFSVLTFFGDPGLGERTFEPFETATLSDLSDIVNPYHHLITRLIAHLVPLLR